MSYHKMKSKHLKLVLIVLSILSCKKSQSVENKDINTSIICKENNIIDKIESSKNKIYASSILDGTDRINYLPGNAFDKNVNTSWCPSNGGIEDFIIFKIPYGIKGIRLTNGVAANKKLFLENNRIRKLYLATITEKYFPQKGMEENDICAESNSKYMTIPITNSMISIYLKDTIEPQEIFLHEITKYKSSAEYWSNEDKLFNYKNSKSLYLVIGIEDIYKGSKYNDTCITEIDIIK